MSFLRRNNRKIFCVGFNKTGTTSLGVALRELGYKIGVEKEAKKLVNHWAKRDFDPIIKYCKSAEAFQDSPFSFPFTYVALDQYFKGSKFILSVRDNSEQWYKSITKFHAKLWGNGHIPTKEDLLAAVNQEKGRPWKVNRLLFKSPESDPYRKEDLIRFYENHNKTVEYYFENRPDDFIKVNVAKAEDYILLCEFLNKQPQRDSFPKENITSKR